MHELHRAFCHRAFAVLIAGVALCAGSVAHAAASAESVERLMQAMQVQRQLETIYAQTLPAMQSAMRQALQRQGAPEETTRAMDAVLPRVNAVVQEELSWAKLKPDFAAIYAETFTQEEVDGLIAFYQGPLGKSLIAKTPQLALRSTQMMQQRIGPMMERMMQIAREEAAKANAGGKARSNAKAASAARR